MMVLISCGLFAEEGMYSVTIQDWHSRWGLTQLCQVLPCWLYLSSCRVLRSSWEPDDCLVLPSSVYTYLSLRIFKHRALPTCENKTSELFFFDFNFNFFLPAFLSNLCLRNNYLVFLLRDILNMTVKQILNSSTARLLGATLPFQANNRNKDDLVKVSVYKQILNLVCHVIRIPSLALFERFYDEKIYLQGIQSSQRRLPSWPQNWNWSSMESSLQGRKRNIFTARYTCKILANLW